AEGLGLTEEEVVKALFMAPSIRPERYTILSKLKLSIKECRRVAKETEVI
ncbi:MAG: glycerol-1-phosphate dehydrogenase, partial [Candidatus Bathyarchaeia archaeon]